MSALKVLFSASLEERSAVAHPPRVCHYDLTSSIMVQMKQMCIKVLRIATCYLLIETPVNNGEGDLKQNVEKALRCEQWRIATGYLL